MASKPYNGFSPKQRSRAGRWYSRERRNRDEDRPCDVCAQLDGVNGHSEDYSEPFGEHIGAWVLCYMCHMVVHSRFRSPESFRWYRDLIAAGRRFTAIIPPNYSRFAARFYACDDREAGQPVRAPLDVVPLLDQLSLDPHWVHPNAPEPVHLP